MVENGNQFAGEYLLIIEGSVESTTHLPCIDAHFRSRSYDWQI